MMKHFMLGTLAALLQAAVVAQCPKPVITPGGPTSFCPGGSVTLSAPVSPTANTWTQKASFGGGSRGGATGFSIGDKGYIGLGYDLYSNKKDFWEYDPATDVWTQKADFGGSVRYGAVGFSIGNKGYMGLGFNTTPLNDFEEYDPATNTWTQKADFGGAGRYYAVGFSIGTEGYVGTGNGTNFTTLKDFWKYSPATDTWTQKADFGGTGRINAVGFGIGAKGYIGTGDDNGGLNGTNVRKDFWEYDPAVDKWTQKADFSGGARSGAFGFSIGMNGYLGAGNAASNSLVGDFWQYNPSTDTWTQKADFAGSGKYEAVGFSIGGKGYAGTGLDGHSPYANSFWSYDVGSTYQWSNGATTANITVTQSGSYTVTVATSDGCTATSDPVVVNSNGFTWVLDADGDGYYTGNPVTQCASPGAGYVVLSNQQPGDCNDGDASIHPGATEIPDDGIDQNCDGYDLKTWYHDSDGDSYGNNADTLHRNTQPAGYVSNNTDCDDTNAAINPATIWYKDADGDGYSDGTTLTQCQRPTGYKLASELTATSGDCRDDLATVHPGAPEICGNGIDDNCNGQIDEGCVPTVTVLPASMQEGNSGKRYMYFTLQLSKPAPGSCEVEFETHDGTARAGSDYNRTHLEVHFYKGQTSRQVGVLIYGDRKVEPDETFQVELEEPHGAGLQIGGTGFATGTIINDDGNYSQTNGIAESKVVEEQATLVVPNLLHRSQLWRIPNLPAPNKIMVVDGNGRVVLQAENYANNKAFTNAAAGLYFYQISTIDENKQAKIYRGKLVIMD